MKIKLLLLLFLVSITQTKAQISATVVNANDKKPIPYVNIWIEDENIGTSANEFGKFEIGEPKDNHRLIFNALGFEIKTLIKEDIKTIIELTPKVYTLNEVKVSPKTLEELKINSFKVEEIKGSFGTGSVPNIVARYFPYDTLYDKTPFLKSIKTAIKSYTKKSTFNIRIYESNTDGTIGKEITKENILVITKIGNFYPEVDVSQLNIQFPENGLFIGLEHLIIDENKNEYDFYFDLPNSRKKEKRIQHSPSFRTEIVKDNYLTWSYIRGKWGIINYETKFSQITKYMKPAIELTLTN
jgi:hypothetical protein